MAGATPLSPFMAGKVQWATVTVTCSGSAITGMTYGTARTHGCHWMGFDDATGQECANYKMTRIGTSLAIDTATTAASAAIAPRELLPKPLPVRQPAPLGFNSAINATELVLEFMEEARQAMPGLTREQFLRLTIADFFGFLMRRAADQDGAACPGDPLSGMPTDVPSAFTPSRARCGGCGRFLPRRMALLKIHHCGSPCLERVLARIAPSEPAPAGTSGSEGGMGEDHEKPLY